MPSWCAPKVSVRTSASGLASSIGSPLHGADLQQDPQLRVGGQGVRG
jgi:hypothetical protein